MTFAKRLSPLIVCLTLIACVTINVYFPAAAAEKAADRIIEEVYGPEPAAPEQPPTPPQENKITPQSKTSLEVFIGALAHALVPVAYAQAEPDISIDSPAISAITERMTQRNPELDPHYASGAVGMTADGSLTLRDANAVPLKDRNQVKQLVADENSDRNALYREVANANGHAEWEQDIRATFARRWIDKAPSGWWYQDGGTWKQK